MAPAPSTTETSTALEIRRTFNAARPRVFAAWTSADALKRWHAPENAEVQAAGVDFRIGGKWHVIMRGYDGNIHHVAGVYREIDEPRRIVLTWRWLSQHDSRESTVTVEFFELAARPKSCLRTTDWSRSRIAPATITAGWAASTSSARSLDR